MPYAEWRARRRGWVMHVPGTGNLVDPARRARWWPAAAGRGREHPLLVSVADPLRVWVEAPSRLDARLSEVALALREASIAEAAQQRLSLDRCAALLAVRVAGASVRSIDRAPAERGASWTRRALHALERLGVLRGAGGRWRELAIAPGALRWPRHRELARWERAGLVWSAPRLSSRLQTLFEGDAIVLREPHSGRTHRPNTVGGWLWLRLVEDRATWQEAVDELVARFGRERRRAFRADVLAAVAEWIALGWVDLDPIAASR